ncbi:glycoside hydrolase family 78 protein [Aaosphaeria arxii CBS 175.79]|uniref:alpha-L-rhamnosidase n=1 Tax=Aaosphaeria arxii CBS 175.79 TaxID=1450172 RepID=A0A6A5X704_9PLEO|nr:glycoside hydrolase family 78 protein [Aaosphaeria arxii CBS 175.79]KAF2008743.1 glycoside hydrolase family 78 protein [Aaosphaeria arxii CBS 175.79]
MATILDLRLEHYDPSHVLGIHECRPRLSWKFTNIANEFRQHAYEIEIVAQDRKGEFIGNAIKVTSPLSNLVPWPFEPDLQSCQKVVLRVRAWDANGHNTAWSAPLTFETGFLKRSDWHCERITAPWAPSTIGPDSEHLYRKEFPITGVVRQARLYITAQGVYEAEINGQRVGDYFLAPGWTAYEGRIQYQTYDVTPLLRYDCKNCIGVRVAEGWFCGRIGFGGGHRNIWGPCPALMVQLEIEFSDSSAQSLSSDSSWTVTKGPIRLAEIYDGEKYDATQETLHWSSPSNEETPLNGEWVDVLSLPPLPESTVLTAGFGGPVRRIETLPPLAISQSPSGKTIVDFGQNLVGYVRLRNIKGAHGHKITLQHAEVLEHGELCTRPLRDCKALDEYTLNGKKEGENYEPRFTFHGFRYAQVDGWIGELDMTSIEAVVCHTEMASAGNFECSDPLLNKLYENIRWGMRGNFLSVPTDCPQRDERLGWSGDLALFAPTAVLIYDCFSMLKNWLIDVEYDQGVLGGVPPMVSPNATLPDPVWCRRVPCAIWHDVTILAPWAMYQETGDEAILAQQYQSMFTWMSVLPRNKTGATHLWDDSIFQLGDWVDPAAPPDAPWKSPTDAKMIANMFLIQSLELMSRISKILSKEDEEKHFRAEADAARIEFHDEYVTTNGRITSDTQAAYALAICLDILSPAQQVRAGARLVELVRKNNFKIATGFAGTPFICEALLLTGNTQVAYAMLIEKQCPSWLYAVTMGATTVWERWDSMLPDGTVNPGEMTSFNHYAYGAVAKFLHERVAGLQRLEPGWKKCRFAPSIGGTFSHASSSHVTPRGKISCSWETRVTASEGIETILLKVSVPYDTVVEVVIPEKGRERTETVGPGEWSFRSKFTRGGGWPVEPLKPKS